MTRGDTYTQLTDPEFKIWNLMKDYNEGREHFRQPSVPYMMDKTGKSRSAVFEIKAALKVKGVIK